MKLNKVVLLIFFIPFIIGAQNLDSLFSRFVELKTGIAVEQPVKEDEHIITDKCAFGTLAMVAENFNYFSKFQQETISALIARPVLDTSIVSPKGYFRIHFDLSNSLNNKPGYDIDSLAVSLDYMYEYETEVLGYLPAPADNGAGGDDLYDFYIVNQSPGLYGYTQPEVQITPTRYICYSVIDNDFKGYQTEYIDAAKVTSAHEYFHAVQIGRYINKYSTQGYYYEISSVAMEEFVYDEINDYYHYMGSYFNKPYIMLSANSGYNTGHWNMFLQQRFGDGILKRIWELMADGNEALKAMEIAISEYGSSFKIEFNTFGIWNFHTNYRADSTKYFEEGANYPLVKATSIIDFTAPKRSVQLTTQPVSNNYIQFNLPTPINDSDTLFAIVTNADILHGCCQDDYRSQVTYSLTTTDETGARSLDGGYYVLLESSELAIFAEATSSGAPDTISSSDPIVFPQPFRYSRHSVLKIPAIPGFDGNAELYIFTASMDLVYNSKKEVFKYNIMEGGEITQTNIVTWNGRDNDGEMLPTGVYIYVTKGDDEISKGKLVIYHD